MLLLIRTQVISIYMISVWMYRKKQKNKKWTMTFIKAGFTSQCVYLDRYHATHVELIFFLCQQLTSGIPLRPPRPLTTLTTIMIIEYYWIRGQKYNMYVLECLVYFQLRRQLKYLLSCHKVMAIQLLFFSFIICPCICVRTFGDFHNP